MYLGTSIGHGSVCRVDLEALARRDGFLEVVGRRTGCLRDDGATELSRRHRSVDSEDRWPRRLPKGVRDGPRHVEPSRTFDSRPCGGLPGNKPTGVVRVIGRDFSNTSGRFWRCKCSSAAIGHLGAAGGPDRSCRDADVSADRDGGSPGIDEAIDFDQSWELGWGRSAGRSRR